MEKTADSGSVADIQAAIDAVFAGGGGDAYVPEGTWDYKILTANPRANFINNTGVGVVIPGGVNLYGAGKGKTILNCPLDGWASGPASNGAIGNLMFAHDGRNGKPVIQSGMTLRGSVYMALGWSDGRKDPDDGITYPQLQGIISYGVTNGRVYNVDTFDFCGVGIAASHNYAQSANPNGNCGVIDHCNVDNPYKDTFLAVTGNLPLWGYGMIVAGGYPLPWDPDWRNWFGKYHHDIWFIEDCTFKRCRHMIAGGAQSYGYYVLRHCHLETMIVSWYGSYQDVHGGMEGCEAYNNVIQNTATDYRSGGYAGQHNGTGLYSRGGFALYHHNEIRDFQQGQPILLTNDQSTWPYARTNGVWIWGNTYINCPAQPVSIAPNYFPIDENMEYFLRAPNQAQDGFIYTPYPYPHPLTLSGVPRLSVDSTPVKVAFQLAQVT